MKITYKFDDGRVEVVECEYIYSIAISQDDKGIGRRQIEAGSLSPAAISLVRNTLLKSAESQLGRLKEHFGKLATILGEDFEKMLAELDKEIEATESVTEEDENIVINKAE